MEYKIEEVDNKCGIVIRRLSDNQTFTLGDKVKTRDGRDIEITKFIIDKNTILIEDDKGIGPIPLEKWEKAEELCVPEGTIFKASAGSVCRIILTPPHVRIVSLEYPFCTFDYSIKAVNAYLNTKEWTIIADEDPIYNKRTISKLLEDHDCSLASKIKEKLGI